MSTLGGLNPWISPEDYLQGELHGELRHEYFAGEVFAMAGASENHNYIAGNIFAELHLHLRGKPCAAFMNDMKAHIQSGGDDWFYYPDVMVNCDPAGQHKYFCDTPSILVEVQSPESETRDWREKRLAYEKIPTLHTCVVVSQEQRAEVIFRRKPDGGWKREVLIEPGEALRFPELGFALPLSAVYARTGL